ncbi:MAG TPA: UvrD-helicase domain-containing protein [Myxococcota bacterium]|nr:UvrD-helicase domain-containing protein [Myxococcota bacterium]
MTPRDLEALDREARIAAQSEFVRPLVLEAGAGTGKTTTLVARTVVWALGAGWERALEEIARDDAASAADLDAVAARVIRGVVAITFSEAAAAEMATRVGRALTDLARGERAPEGVEEAFLPDASERRLRARSLLAVLDRLSIRTIHAFCRRLLAQHPLEAGLHPGFQVDADGRLAAEVAREVVEASLARAYGDPGDERFLALAVRGSGPAELADALALLLQSDVPVEALAAAGYEKSTIAPLLTGLHEVVDGFTPEHVAALRRAGRANSLAQRIAEALDATRAALAGERTPGDAGSLAEWIESLAAHWPSNLRDRLGEWAKGEFGRQEAVALGPHADAVRAPARALRERLRAVLALEPVVFEEARAVLQPLLAEAHGTLARRGVVGFDGLLRRARDLLLAQPAVAARERARIRQLLVDEFQDTDAVQCDLLRALALSGPLGDRPGLFLVGDPKQSIYGWRSADLRAYDAFRSDVERAGGVLHRLSVNFRSAPVILDEVERLLGPQFREERGVQPSFQRLVASPNTRDDPGFRDARFAPVEHWLPCRFDEDRLPLAPTRAPEAVAVEAAALARDLVALRASSAIPWSEIALLFRTFTHVDRYLETLRDAGIPYEVAKDRTYYRRREVIEAAALVRCVIDPHDQLALVTWLRSAVVGVPDAAWVPLFARKLPVAVAALDGATARPLEEVREIVAAAVAALPKDVPRLDRLRGWDRSLVAALEALARLRASFRRDAADVFIDRLRGESGLEIAEAARHLGPYRAANLERFFRELGEALIAGEDAAAILRRLRSDVANAREVEQASLRESASDAVQVLTIFGAKGLDFEHVYCLQLHKGIAGSGREDANRVARSPDGLALRLLGSWGPGGPAALAAQRLREDAERLRLLYVAATRAKRRLVLSGLRDGLLKAGQAEQGFAANLEGRAETPPAQVLAAALASEAQTHRDVAGACFVCPALEEPSEPLRVATTVGARAPSREEAAADASRLAEARAGAAAYAARPFSAPASAASHEANGDLAEDDEPRSDGVSVVGGRGVAREVARAVGTAVHRALEHAELASSLGPQLPRLLEIADAALRSAIAGEALDTALARARALLQAFAAGPLPARLRERLGEESLAFQELPVLLAPERARATGPDDARPVGFYVGTIDLLYRDAASRRFVVADWKTDDATEEGPLRERVVRYAAQGRVYVDAVQAALRLDHTPRFELWFLRAGQVWDASDPGDPRRIDGP